jgi:hypothetical protein
LARLGDDPIGKLVDFRAHLSKSYYSAAPALTMSLEGGNNSLIELLKQAAPDKADKCETWVKKLQAEDIDTAKAARNLSKEAIGELQVSVVLKDILRAICAAGEKDDDALHVQDEVEDE